MIPHALKNSHCSFCGAYFLNQKSWPRKCAICENVTYSNPLPVSVSMIRVATNIGIGILLIRRAIQPKLGEWALPGGYLVTGETWAEGAARELKEEVGVEVDFKDIICYDVVNATTTNNLLIFNTCKKVLRWDDIKFVVNEEVNDIDVAFLPTELAFPTHTEFLQRYLKELNGDYYGI